MATGYPDLKFDYAFTVRASLRPPAVIGEGPEGLRRFVPITAAPSRGRCSVARSSREVATGRSCRRRRLNADARYTLEADNGEASSACITAASGMPPPDIMAKLDEGRASRHRRRTTSERYALSRRRATAHSNT